MQLSHGVASTSVSQTIASDTNHVGRICGRVFANKKDQALGSTVTICSKYWRKNSFIIQFYFFPPHFSLTVHTFHLSRFEILGNLIVASIADVQRWGHINIFIVVSVMGGHEE